MIAIRSLTMMWIVIVLMGITWITNSKKIDVNQLQMAAIITSALPKTKANYIISPLNIDVGLSTIYQGIGNATCKAQLETLMGNTIEDANKKREYIRLYTSYFDYRFTLTFLNAIFYSLNTELLPEYKDKVKALFKTTFEQINFSDTVNAKQTINNFISEATNNKIKNVVDTIDPRTKIMSENVLYFRAFWKEPFEDRYMRTFHGAKGINKDILMMTIDTNVSFSYSDEHKFTMIAKPYETSHFQMVLILPYQSSNINDLEKRILEKPYIINDGLRDSEEGSMQVTMPVLKMEETLDMKEILLAKNVTCIFKCGLNKLATKVMSVSKITHKVRFEADEKGSRGSAVFETRYIDKIAPARFTADRPYMFMVVDTDSGYIIFMGKQTIPN